MKPFNDLLLYRRQFLLCREALNELATWKSSKIGGYVLHTHPDLEVTTATSGRSTITILGYLFDPSRPEATNLDVITKALSNSTDFYSLTIAFKPFPGRYACFYEEGSRLYLFQDALALREVYYCQQVNRVVCGSQPNVMAAFSEPKIEQSSDPEVVDFVRNHLPRVRSGRLWPGDGTPFQGVKHLLPNHALDVHQRKSARYWPNGQIGGLDIDEAVEKCAAFLQGALKAAAIRQPLMLAVTAGLDSRSLLAASKDISESVYFFVNKHSGLSESSPDIRIPSEIFRRIGLPFHINEPPKEVPPEFRSTLLRSTMYAKETLMGEIYQYYTDHGNKLNILGVGEVGRTKFYDEPKTVTPYYLAYMLKHRRSTYATRECSAWLEQSRPVARQYGLNIMTLFWWEVLIGNWGSVGNSESDVAIEEFDPYASHFIYESFLGVDPRYRTFKDNILFDKLIRFMWPELMDVPVNPPEGLKARWQLALHKCGLEGVSRQLKYQAYSLYYGLRCKSRPLPDPHVHDSPAGMLRCL